MKLKGQNGIWRVRDIGTYLREFLDSFLPALGYVSGVFAPKMGVAPPTYARVYNERKKRRIANRFEDVFSQFFPLSDVSSIPCAWSYKIFKNS